MSEFLTNNIPTAYQKYFILSIYIYTFQFFFLFFSAFMGIVAMFLKTLRILIIVKSGIRKIRIGPGHVLSLMCFMYFFWLIYLAVYTSIDPPRMHVAFAENRLTGQLTEIRSCTKGKYRLDLFLIVLEAGIITATAVLCFLTREVPDAINESKAIALCKYMLYVFVYVLCVSTCILCVHGYCGNICWFAD
jgi:7 transmembrane sweet-taste receptor of 3 GCPR